MSSQWKNDIHRFISLCHQQNVRMIMIGGGAVNFHGYQRHSADVDFWIDTTKENFKNLLKVLNEMGLNVADFPRKVYDQQQNISLKFSPADIDIELITNFSINKSFEEALAESIEAKIDGRTIAKYRVLSFDDLIVSKEKSGRPKDLLDVQELKRINRD